MHHLFFFCRNFVLASVLLSFGASAAAQDSVSDRKRIASAKAKRFYRNSNRVNKALSLAGSYDSDYNSKEYQLDMRYFFQSSRQMHEIDFLRQVRYANVSSSNKNLVQKDNQYDLEISSKMRLAETNNYLALYSRSNYDDLSKYYYDLRNAVGVGRIFFDDKVEFDVSAGYRNTMTYGNRMFLVPSLRLNLKISPRCSLISRSYVFVDSNGLDDEFKTSIRYQLNKDVSFEVNHTFNKRRYIDEDTSQQLMQVRRFISLGFVFNLN